MEKELNQLDAFISLRDVEDEDVLPMLKESRAYDLYSNIFSPSVLEDAKEFNDTTDKENAEIEVIDANADSVDHIADNISYVGQAILRCNKCMSNRFMDMNKLVKDPDDEKIFNIDDECPNCHCDGFGYTLIGQVGKVADEEPEEEISIDNEEKIDDVEDEEKIQITDDEEEKEPEAEEEKAPENEASDEEEDFTPQFADEEESDFMETEEPEDEEMNPKAGDVVEESVNVDDEAETDIYGAHYYDYFGDAETTKYGEKAFMLNSILQAMADQRAGNNLNWMEVFPESETLVDCYFDFGNEDDYKELFDIFTPIYKEYHSYGLYEAENDVIEAAHEIDKLLQLPEIENTIKQEKVVEKKDIKTMRNLCENFVDIDNVNRFSILNNNGEEIYSGDYEDIPLDLLGNDICGYDTCGTYLIINVTKDDVNNKNTVKDILNLFNDLDSENILVHDSTTDEEIGLGTKDEICNKFGDYKFNYFNTPRTLRVKILSDKCNDENNIRPYNSENDPEMLVLDVIKANGLNCENVSDSKCDEYWIRYSIINHEDLDLIFKNYILPLNDENMINRFKTICNYRTAVEEAYDNSITETKARVDDPVEAKNEAKDMIENNYAVVYGYSGQGGKFFKLLNMIPCRDSRELDLAIKMVKNTYHPQGSIYTEYNKENVNKIFNNEEEKELATANEAVNNEEIKSFKNRKELAEAIKDCKNNIRPYSVRRSQNKGYRYDLIIKEGVSAAAEDIDEVDFDDDELTYGEYIEEAKRFARSVANMDLETVKKWFYDDYEFDKHEPQDAAEEIVYNSLKAYLDEHEKNESLDPEIPEDQTITVEVVDEKMMNEADVISPDDDNDEELAGFIHEDIDLSSDTPEEVAANIDDQDVKEVQDEHENTLDAINDVEDDVDKMLDQLDIELNQYFNETYDNTVYLSLNENKTINEDKSILVEGILSAEDKDMDVTFTLTPKADNSSYIVKNNISDEVFDFTYDK